MMQLAVKIPQVNQSYYSASNKVQVKEKMRTIYLRYKASIDQAARLCNVDKDYITSLIFIESTGNPDAVSGAGAVGLMQLVPAGASDILVMENLKKRLSEPEKTVLRKTLGARLDKGILAMKFLGDKKTVDGVTSAVWVTKKDLLNTDFNILVGTIYLSLLIDESVQDGKLRLDKIIVRYNMGYFAKSKGKDLPSSPELSMVSNLPTETKNYITKFAGTNGTLDLLKA